MWQVIKYMDENPQASFKEVIGHFATEFEVDNQLSYLQQEVDGVLTIRDQLRPLYGQKSNAEINLSLFDSDFDMEVMIKYPPRQGTDKDRKAYKKELQSDHEEYSALSQKLEGYKDEIQELEAQMTDIQQRAKNARRILETFNHCMAFIMACQGGATVPFFGEGPQNAKMPVSAGNANMF